MAEIFTTEDLEAFFLEKGDEVFTYLKALSRDEDVAADLAQTVMMKFIEQVEKGKILKATAAQYMFTMCKNEYLMHYRREKRVTPITAEEELPADDQLKKRETNSREIHIILVEALNDGRIPEEIAHVLRLRLLHDKSYEEICANTGKSRTTIHRLFVKGLAQLERIYREAGIHPEELDL